MLFAAQLPHPVYISKDSMVVNVFIKKLSIKINSM